MTESGCIEVEHLPESVRRSELCDLAERVEEERTASNGTLARAERARILEVYERLNGHHEGAARELGISSRTLSRKLRSYRMEGLRHGIPA